MYSKFVPVGGYIIVNDTNLEEMGAIRENLITRLTNHSAGRGPLSAVKRFLQANKAFQVDEHLPSTLISCAPSGFLDQSLMPSLE
jgi:cephalosporin hydroxylase